MCLFKASPKLKFALYSLSLLHLILWKKPLSGTEPDSYSLSVACLHSNRTLFFKHDDADTVAFSEIPHLLYQMQGQVFPNKKAAFLIHFTDNIGRRVVIIFRELLLQQNVFIGAAVLGYNRSEAVSGMS